MSVKTFDPKNLLISAGPNQLTGFAEGSFVTVARDEDAFNLTVGSDGEGARAKSNIKSGTVTLTLLQSSAGNDILSTLAKSDELNGGGVFPLLVKDASGRSLFAAETAWVQKLPDSEFSNEITSREWVIRTDKLEAFVGGL